MKWGLLRTWWDALPRGLETVKQRFQCGLPEGREQDTWVDPRGRSGCDFWTIISTCGSLLEEPVCQKSSEEGVELCGITFNSAHQARFVPFSHLKMSFHSGNQSNFSQILHSF